MNISKEEYETLVSTKLLLIEANETIQEQRRIIHDLLGCVKSNNRQGEWIEDNGILACTNCQTIWINRKPTDYCPNCGAYMRGSNNE